MEKSSPMSTEGPAVALRPAAGAATRVGAVTGGVAATALWAAGHGWANLRKYKKGQISKEEAIQNTTAESVGMGLATAAAIVAMNAVRASTLVFTSSAMVPFLVGTAVAGGAKAVWEQKVVRRESRVA